MAPVNMAGRVETESTNTHANAQLDTLEPIVKQVSLV